MRNQTKRFSFLSFFLSTPSNLKTVVHNETFSCRKTLESFVLKWEREIQFFFNYNVVSFVVKFAKFCEREKRNWISNLSKITNVFFRVGLERTVDETKLHGKKSEETYPSHFSLKKRETKRRRRVVTKGVCSSNLKCFRTVSIILAKE